ncbi:MAG: 3-dehydroquinate synthase [Oscillospiraceae bacterium]|nr:3-dehydroquinate synthase [Oscillospiraceae bacterium]
MTTVKIPLPGRSYDVLIGGGLLGRAGERCAAALEACLPRRILLVSDETVLSLYGERTLASFRGAGFICEAFAFPAGEGSKSLAVCEELLNACAAFELSGSDILAALGGGVVGDITGFAASCYRRGTRFIQIPTTLLAAVDSSVGGKTGVNLAAGKNLAGAFWQPSLVLCDPLTHQTLSRESYADGLAECLKYGMLWDETLFAALENGALYAVTQEQIARCVALKRDVVLQDERDEGERRLLNLGHTLGHALEKSSGYAIPHGAAVGIGMLLITRLAESRGWCGGTVLPRLRGALERGGLPTQCPYTTSQLFTALAQDKKRAGSEITIVVPERVGQCSLRTLPLAELRRLLEELDHA